MQHPAAKAAVKARVHGIQSLTRAASVLRALREDNSGSSLGQLANRVNLPRSTVQRIVNALIGEGLVISGGATGGYRLGPEILLLADAIRQDVARELHPMIARLAANAGETVDLAVFRNDQMVFIDQVVGTQRLRTVSAIGESFPLTITANGKAAMSLLDEVSCKRIIEAETSKPGTSRSPRKLAKEIQRIALDGFALDIDEHTAGISAAGIAFKTGGMIYAVSIPAPSSRFEEKQAMLIDNLLDFKNSLDNVLPLTN